MVYIIGNGRVGTALSEASTHTRLFARSDALEPLEDLKQDDLVFVCTRNDDLQGVIDSLPLAALDKLVFVQNGMLSPFLGALSPQPAARAILFFAVSAKGEDIVSGASTPVSGVRGSEVVDFFKSIDVPSSLISEAQLKELEIEKLLWNSVMGLIGQAYDEKVGDTLELHWQEVEEIVLELLPVVKADLGIDMDSSQLLKALKSYSKEVDYYSARVKEWKWRNAWFFDAMKRQSMEAPLWEAKHKELGLNQSD